MVPTQFSVRRWHSLQAGIVLLWFVVCTPSGLCQSQSTAPKVGLGFSEAPAPLDQQTLSAKPLEPTTSVLPTKTANTVPVRNLEDPSLTDPSVIPAGCSSCGSGSYSNFGAAGIGSRPANLAGIHDNLFNDNCATCGKLPCFPGQDGCPSCDHDDTAAGRFLCGLYNCLCCQDPCYEGRWTPISDAAFFVEQPRPVSQQRLRWDSGINMILPDRAEYFWARADGQGKGPAPTGPFLVAPRLNYNELSLYTEIAAGNLGIIVETPYRSVNPEYVDPAAGFADMNIATKTMLYDCELLQVAFMFRTFMPVGRASKGLGVGHVSLEPSLIFGIKLSPDAYLQGQVAEWIPLGGDPDYSGAILHYHFSFNRTMIRLLPDVPIIGTFEFGGFSFQDGAFTDPIDGPFQGASGRTYFYGGGGLRMFVCDRIDFGLGFQSALTEQHFSDQLIRSEFRFRY